MTGRILDAATGMGLVDVTIRIAGTAMGTTSGVDGRYSIAAVPEGKITLTARRIGFTPKSVTEIAVKSGRATEQDIGLSRAVTTLSSMIVTASSESGTVNLALDDQRTAVGVVNSITAEQIAKSPDANAAQAVQRVSGVTVQDNKYVFVRGLGERYTTTSLNGARIPSPEPEKRVVPLDMFPAALLQTITTTKTFTPDLQGDFSGALVNIRTREFPAFRSGSFQVGGGYQPGTTGTDIIVPRLAGGEAIGIVANRRALPSLLRSLGNLQNINLTPGDKSVLVSQFRDSWTPIAGKPVPSLSTSGSLGGNDPLLFGHRLGYLLSATFSRGTDFRDGEVRALANRGNVRGQTTEIDRFVGAHATQHVLWGGLGNFSTMLGANSRIALNAMYSRTADNSAIVETGSFENEGIRAKINRMDYVERGVRSFQLLGEHQVGSRHRFDWAVTSSGVRRYEPDRSEFVQAIEKDTPAGADILRWQNSGNAGATRTFSDLRETSREANGSYQFTFGSGRQHSIKIGAFSRHTDRNADTRAYAISAKGISNAIRELSPEQIFDGRFADSLFFDIGPLGQGGSYTARDRLAAGFAMTEIALGARFRLVGGARYESDRVNVNAFSTLGSAVYTNKIWNDLLPSLALNWKLGETQQIRLSGSRTLARPEYRELSPIKSRAVLNGDDTQGNENLSRTTVVNADARWEWYPGTGEVISVALFAKKFRLPIERVYRASGSGTRTVFYTNAESADNYGIEFDIRKNLGFLGSLATAFQLFANVTVMQSTIHLFKDTEASATNLSRRMVGQAPYVINGGLGYASRDGATTANLLFNRVGERIEAAGDSPLPDVIQLPRNSLDLAIRIGIFPRVAVRFDGKNLLDSPYRTVQGSATREEYRAGRMFDLGFQIRR